MKKVPKRRAQKSRRKFLGRPTGRSKGTKKKQVGGIIDHLALALERELEELFGESKSKKSKKR